VKVTPRHNKFIEAIADSQIHVIATMRGKDQYEIETSETGKMNVRKLGVGAEQRKDFEYEFTCTFSLEQNSNLATPQKDNTHLFENEGSFLLTEEQGEDFIKWANSGAGFTPTVRHRKTEEEILDETKREVVELCKDLGGSSDEALMEVLKKYEKNGNPNKIKDNEERQKLLEELKEMKESK